MNPTPFILALNVAAGIGGALLWLSVFQDQQTQRNSVLVFLLNWSIITIYLWFSIVNLGFLVFGYADHTYHYLIHLVQWILLSIIPLQAKLVTTRWRRRLERQAVTQEDIVDNG